MRPVCVIVRDGWGYNENPTGNAVLAANTPNIRSYLRDCPWTLLDTAGESVGLPAGYQGSSEVGHLNMGAGRIVVQELKRIDDALSEGSLFNCIRWRKVMEDWRAGRGRLHFMGLLQDEGVHAHQEHLFKMARQARLENPSGEIVVHAFLDGRDTPPRSCLEFLNTLEGVIDEIGNCSIGTIMGRYYAMDRSREWALTDIAYNCIVCADGRHAESSAPAVEESYEKDMTPDGGQMFDEYIRPYCIGQYNGVRDRDCVVHTNYRQDRAIQLSQAFVDPTYPGTLCRKVRVTYLGLTRYYDEFTEYMMEPIDSGGTLGGLLGEVISDAGLRQLRIAETQKYRHVTSFFNGKATTPYAGEDDIEVKSRFAPATFASHPEMEAYNVTNVLLSQLEENPYSFVLVNYANGDMVGHTGNLQAAKQAIEVVDQCIGRIVRRLLELDAHILITADHGNAEQMIDYRTGMVKTSHTLFPVECIYVARDAACKRLIARGKLSDIAPTVLQLMGLEIPKEMTADILFKK